MVDLTLLIPIMLLVASLELATLMVLLRWARRWRRSRSYRRLDADTQRHLAALHAPGAGTLRRERVIMALGLVVTAVVSWGFVEPNLLEVSTYRVTSAKLRPNSTIRVAHLSDLHFESDAHLARDILGEFSRLRPDIIVFTGDAVNDETGLPGFRRLMTSLAKIAPTYSVRGNWETWWFPQLDLYGGTGVTPLGGRSATVTLRGDTLWLAGVDIDREQQLPAALRPVNGGQFTILLHHFPALAPQVAARGVDLMLAGDTHGGQARVPLLGELVRISRRDYWRPSGLRREGKLWLFVNRGVGNEGGIPRFRFGCRPELAIIELRGP